MSFNDQYILIVDDNIGVRLLLYEALTNEGYNIELAPNGNEALIKIREKYPVLIVLDEMMLNMSGMGLVAVLNNLAPELPVIMITAYSEKICDVVKEHKQIKFFLSKPFDLKILFDKIQTLVS